MTQQHIHIFMPKLYNSYLGIFIDDPYKPISHVEVESRTMHYLGFVDYYSDYVGSYPGKMLNVNNITHQSLPSRLRKKRRKKNKNKPKIEIKSVSEDFYVLEVFLFNKTNTIRNRIIEIVRQACKSDYMSMFMVATPSIKQLKRVNGFTSAKPKDFWFCCDWQDSYGHKDKL